MTLRPGPAPDPRARAGYLSPNDPFAVDWHPRGAPSTVVAAPDDLVKRGSDAAAAPQRGADGRELVAMRERVSYLEGALAQSEKIEAAAQAFADTLEQRSSEERERYLEELDGLRTQLEHKERELRTLALEMGKVQGRLEATQTKLLAAGPERARSEPSPAGPAPGWGPSAGAATARVWTETSGGMFLIGVVTVGVVVLLLALL